MKDAFLRWKEREFGHRKGRIFVAFLLLLIIALTLTTGFQQNLRERAFDYLQVLHWYVAGIEPDFDRRVWVAAIDEASLSDVGTYPYPRRRVADLLEKIAAFQPAAIGLDVFYSDWSDNRLDDEWLVATMATTERLVLGHPKGEADEGFVVDDPALAVLGVEVLTSNSASIQLLPELGSFLSTSFENIDPLDGDIREIDRHVAGHGFINDDWSDEPKLRRMPLLVQYESTRYAAFAAEIVRVAIDATNYQLIGSDKDLAAIQIDGSGTQLTALLNQSGFVRPRFRPMAQDRHISVKTIQDQSKSVTIQSGDIVLIGATALTVDDVGQTAFGEMPGVEIHAQIIESLLAEDFWWRPPFAGIIEAGLVILTAGTLLWSVPALSLALASALVATLAIAVLIFNMIIMEFGRLLIDPTSVIGTAIIVFILLYAVRVIVERQRRKLAEAERLTLETQLEVARDIQNSILAQPSKIKGLPGSIKLEAKLVQSNFVGGDFYDVFMIDSERLFITVADVSGKGWSGAFFMAIAKAFLQSCALGDSNGPAQIVSRAEREIMRNNPHGLFVTAIVGILNVRTGRLELCNAGHPPPVTIISGQACQSLTTSNAPPIGMVPGFSYGASQHQLRNGETLLMFTDGFADLSDRLVGDSMGDMRRFLDSQRDSRHGMLPAETIVERAIHAGNPAEDDITLLMVHYA